MRRLHLSALAALVFASAWASGASAQDTITAAELARHGYKVPAENIMLVVISHTAGYDYAVNCVIHAEGANLKEEVGEIKPGEDKVAGVNVEQMTGQLWVQCSEEDEGGSYSSNNFPAVGRTLVHFTTGAKFIIPQKIVP